jgi:hypothetical protein
MSNGNTVYGEIEIGLHQLQPEAIEVELRVSDPDTQGEITPARGQVPISPEKLLDELLEWEIEPQQYGEVLATYLFQDDSIRKLYHETKAAFESRGRGLRLRLLVGNSAAKLHGVRWELLCDPDTKRPLATSEQILFSRFMLSQDWRVIKLRPKAELKALVAVSAPGDLAKFRLADVDKQGEIARAREALAGIHTTVIGQNEPLTLTGLINAIRHDVDVLYLVCHGAFPREKQEPMLFLQDEDGNTAIVKASDLAQRINELQEAPRLIVLASCESAGREDGAEATDGTPAAQSALAPRLAQAGVPAVIAMQGKISMETVRQAMPIFFRELLKDGQIDRAMAAARGAVREQDDSWMPALFTRLKSGRIWYEPGFAGGGKEEFQKWSAICHRIHKGEFIPILGPELGEDVFGGTRELASELAEKHAFPLATHDRTDLAKVSQFISTSQDRDFAQEKVQNQFLLQLSERLAKHPGQSTNSNPKRTLPEFLDLALERCRADENHPYRILAELPAAIYLNASPETMLYRSLKAAGKNPEAVFCSWRGKEVPKQPQPKALSPTPETPWVYHVFGLFGKPDTIVLTEDDFFDYLIATSRLDLLLPTLVGRLMQSSLLFLGFRLDDWRFRVLFRMIVTRQGIETMKELSHVGVQVNPDENSLADVERARKYMESYFQESKGGAPNISIYWGTSADFWKELRKRLNETRAEETAPVIQSGQEGNDDWL